MRRDHERREAGAVRAVAVRERGVAAGAAGEAGSQVVPGAGRASAFSQPEQESQWDKIKNAENNSFSQLMGR